MPFYIGNKRLVPAPIVNIQKQINFAGDGKPINKVYNINLDGTLLPGKGSPRTDGFYMGPGDPPDQSFSTDEDKFNAILAKQEWLREELAATGWKLSYSPPGLPPVECYPKLNSISFSPGTWVIRCDYSASLEAASLDRSLTNDDIDNYNNASTQQLNLTSVTDDYSIQEREDGQNILSVSRTISATAAFRYQGSGNREAWENARTWVLDRRANYPFTSGLADIIGNISASSYNVVEEESINAFAGQYSISQRFTYSLRDYIESRTINKTVEPNRLGDGGPEITRINVNGTIQGLSPTNAPSGKFNAASGYWNSIYSSIGASVGALGQPVNTSLDIDQYNGTINYSLQYINNSGIFYKHTYDVNYQQGQDYPTVTINGTIEGYTPDDLYYGVGSNYTKFDNALSGWNAVSGTIKDLAFTYPSLSPTGSIFGNTPLTRNISYNKANGTINYNYTYAFTSGVATNYQHTYTIDLSTDNSPADASRGGTLCTVTMNGEILGLASSLDPLVKLNNAKTGWNTVRSTLYSLANAEYSLLGGSMPTLASGFVRKAVTLNQRGGSLNYAVTFNNSPPTSSSGVAVEDVQIEDVYPQDLFAIQNIPGRLSGPIIQNIATVSERRRNVTISLTMYPKPGSPFYWTYADKSVPFSIGSGILATLVPAGIRGSGYYFAGDTDSWQYKNGFYNRTVSIVY